MKLSVIIAFLSLFVFEFSGCNESHNNPVLFENDEFLSSLTDDHKNVICLSDLNLRFNSYEKFLSMATPWDESLIHYNEYYSHRHDFFDESVFEHIWATGYKGYVLVSELRCHSLDSFFNPFLRIYSILKDGQLVVVYGYSYKKRDEINEKDNN